MDRKSLALPKSHNGPRVPLQSATSLLFLIRNSPLYRNNRSALSVGLGLVNFHPHHSFLRARSHLVHGFIAIRRFLALAPPERWLLIEAMLLVLAMRATLALGRFQPARKRLRFSSNFNSIRPRDGCTIDSISRALSRAARYLPRTTCLVQALAGIRMLGRRGYPSSLCLGVAKPDGAFAAHAWIECECGTVIGSAAGFSKVFVVPEVRP